MTSSLTAIARTPPPKRRMSRALLAAACLGSLALAACQSDTPPPPPARAAAPAPQAAAPSAPPSINSASTLCNERALGPLGEAIGALDSGQTAATIVPNLEKSRMGIDGCLGQMTRPSAAATQCFRSARTSIQRAETMLAAANPNRATVRTQMTSADRRLTGCISTHLRS